MWVKTRGEKETKEIAGFLARKFLKKESKHALIIGLRGELGSGKTAFVQGFARALGIKRSLTSPTFLIIRSYKLKNSARRQVDKNLELLYHIDAYRIKKTNEMDALGFKEIVRDPKNIVLIEWADKIRKLLPKRTLIINFRHGQQENERIIKIGIKKGNSLLQAML